MHTSSDSIFYKNYILHYVNILHHLDHDLVIHNNKIECIKTNLHMKCRNLIFGLHILAKNRIPESILHTNVFKNILHGLSQYLIKGNVYTLLYGTAVNPYYSMDIVKRIIINDVFLMTMSLPLKHHRAPILSLYGLFSYYLPTKMSDGKSLSSSYTKLQVSHPYLLLGDDQFALLNSDFDRQVVQYDHIAVHYAKHRQSGADISNLLSVCSPPRWNIPTLLKANVRSLLYKVDDLQCVCWYNGIDICVITETC